jgi:hypothetical protein
MLYDLAFGLNVISPSRKSTLRVGLWGGRIDKAAAGEKVCAANFFTCGG